MDITTQFKDIIFLDEQYLQPDLSVSYSVNSIRHFQGIVLGRPGSGKSILARWVAEQLINKYGSENVTAVSSVSDLQGLLDGVEDTLINFLFLDDLTLAKISKSDLADFFRIRHVIENNTGRTNGLVITLLGLHRFYGCDPSIRTNFDFLMFRSAPTNKYDRNFTTGYLGDINMNLLENLELDRMKDPDLFPITLAWLKTVGAGTIITPAPQHNTIQSVRRKQLEAKIEYDISRRERIKNEIEAEYQEILRRARG